MEQIVPRARLRRGITPSEVEVDTVPTLLFDATDVARGEALVIINNRGGASIFVALGVSGATAPGGLTTTSGLEFGTGSLVLLDDVGGMALWAVAAALQAAPAGTRVSGGKT